jgi:hypothetical protein
MSKIISTVCGVTVAIALGAASTGHAASFFSADLKLVNNTPDKDNGPGHDPPDTYSDGFTNLLNVNRSKTLPTPDTGGAFLGANGTVTTSLQFIGNSLGQFGIHSNSLVVVDRGAPIGSYGGDSYVDASVQDTWFLNAVPRYTNLRVRALWNVQGALTANANGLDDNNFGTIIHEQATDTLDFSGSGVTSGLRAFSQSSSSLGNSHLSPPHQILLDMVFRNHVGSPYSFFVNAYTAASVSYGDYSYQYPGTSAIATLDFGHTFTWGGITSVSDADTGEEITDWTLTSESGFDWIHAADEVPEPSSLITALAAIVLLLPTRRPSVRESYKRICR